MTGDPFDGLFGGTLDRWSDLDTDWQGVLLAMAIAALVGLSDVAIPW